MKKIALYLCLMLTICIVSGCGVYHHIKAEEGSKWTSADGAISITIVNGGSGAEGILKHGDVFLDIYIYFGPGKTDYAVYEKESRTDGDSWLFEGDYYYSEKKKKITLKILEDQIGINKKEIILKRS